MLKLSLVLLACFTPITGENCTPFKVYDCFTTVDGSVTVYKTDGSWYKKILDPKKEVEC